MEQVQSVAVWRRGGPKDINPISFSPPHPNSSEISNMIKMFTSIVRFRVCSSFSPLDHIARPIRLFWPPICRLLHWGQRLFISPQYESSSLTHVPTFCAALCQTPLNADTPPPLPPTTTVVLLKATNSISSPLRYRRKPPHWDTTMSKRSISASSPEAPFADPPSQRDPSDSFHLSQSSSDGSLFSKVRPPLDTRVDCGKDHSRQSSDQALTAIGLREGNGAFAYEDEHVRVRTKN